jgi:hypothetical protein
VYIYLDESGDLGFDFKNKKPSKFFTICILIIDNLAGTKSTKNFLKRIKYDNKLKEIKGINTTTKIKQKIFRKIRKLDFKIYAITIDKQSYKNINNIYNELTTKLLKNIDFPEIITNIFFTLDKSKNYKEIKIFNRYIEEQIELITNKKVVIDFKHRDSKENYFLNLVDLFAYGIFKKYEKNDLEWYNNFKDKIKVEIILK